MGWERKRVIDGVFDMETALIYILGILNLAHFHVLRFLVWRYFSVFRKYPFLLLVEELINMLFE